MTIAIISRRSLSQGVNMDTRDLSGTNAITCNNRSYFYTNH